MQQLRPRCVVVFDFHYGLFFSKGVDFRTVCVNGVQFWFWFLDSGCCLAEYFLFLLRGPRTFTPRSTDILYPPVAISGVAFVEYFALTNILSSLAIGCELAGNFADLHFFMVLLFGFNIMRLRDEGLYEVFDCLLIGPFGVAFILFKERGE